MFMVRYLGRYLTLRSLRDIILGPLLKGPWMALAVGNSGVGSGEDMV